MTWILKGKPFYACKEHTYTISKYNILEKLGDLEHAVFWQILAKHANHKCRYCTKRGTYKVVLVFYDRLL